jgi:hypothetical protein
MKKLVFLLLCLMFPLVISCQTIRTYSYGLNLPAYALNGTRLTSTFTQLNYLNTMTGNVKAALDAKQALLVSGTNIKSVGGNSLLGSGDISISGLGSVTSVSVVSTNGITGSVATPTSTPAITLTLGAITPTSVNALVLTRQAVGFTIAGGTSYKTLNVTLDATVSGVNSGDNAVNSLYSGLVTNATHTGDVTGATALTIANQAVTLAKMANMANGSLIYRKTTGVGIPEVQTLATLKADLGLTNTNSGDQTSVTGNAGTATKWAAPILINGVSTDGSTNVTIPSNIAPGTAGNVMTSTGTVWSSAAPASVTVSARIDSIVAVLKDTIPLGNVAVLKHGTITAQTASYSLVLADDGTTITMNVASANNLTVPLNSAQAFPIGTVINIECIGAGKTTVVATGGVTLISKGSLTGITILGDATLHKLGTNTWKLIGSLE